MIRHHAPASAGASLKKEIIIVGLAAAILLDLAALAQAQTDRSAASSGRSAETTGQAAKPQEGPSPERAPVGHFQPSPRELPNLGNEDISRTKEQIDFDKSLNICKGC